MKIVDTLFANLYLGQVSREAVGYSQTPRGQEPDHTWSTFKKMDAAFRAKHPDLAPALNDFMRREKEKHGENFVEGFKLHSLALFVTTQTNLLT